MGPLVLEGGAEFGGRMSEPDRRALELAGGFDAPVCILPAAAAPDHNHRRAGRNGVRWFKSLGAARVVSLDVIDRASAADEALAAEVRAARLIYLPGGFPRHLAETLADSACWRAACAAWAAGAVIAGSSAGAMVLCGHYYDPHSDTVRRGLGLLPNACVLPHHDRFGKSWAERLGRDLPGVTLLGIEEATGLIDDEPGGWRVYGAGTVTVYAGGAARVHARGAAFSF